MCHHLVPLRAIKDLTVECIAAEKHRLRQLLLLNSYFLVSGLCSGVWFLHMLTFHSYEILILWAARGTRASGVVESNLSHLRDMIGDIQ